MQDGDTPLVGATKDEFEVWVYRLQPPSSGLRMNWDVLMSGINTVEDARQYRDFLVEAGKFDRSQVMLKQITWTATEIGIVS